MTLSLAQLSARLQSIPSQRHFGRVTAVAGMLVEIGGAERQLSVGSRCSVHAGGGRRLAAEVVGFRDGRALAMPFGPLDGVGLGCRVDVESAQAEIDPGPAWLGRVIDALGRPLDSLGNLPSGGAPTALRASPPPAHLRQRLGGRIDVGVRALNSFVTCCAGQRLGIFAGSGVGKSVLLSMLARHTEADVIVIGLIGERGREVQEFLTETLGPEGLARSVVVVATSDEPPLMRRQAAFTTLAVAEAFRNRGHHVLCLMDSVTRFAMALREIGLSAGEPPTSKGYPPSTFAELARLLERAGPGTAGQGAITGLFTVLVEGDDHNEPVADAVRGILDGHVVMDRKIAERGRYPAIDVLKSVSRTVPACHSAEETRLIRDARALLSTYDDMAELIRLGAYRRGSDPAVDRAIALQPAIEALLSQRPDERTSIEDSFAGLAEILDGGRDRAAA